MKVPRGRGGLAACLCFSALGCKTIEGSYAIVPPIYEAYGTPSSVGAGKGSEVFFRPLGSFETLDSKRDGPEKSTSHLRFLSPFLDFEWGLDGERYWALPLFLYSSFEKPSGGRDMDWMLFPFFYGGSDPEEGAYFAFFPVGGVVKGLLGHAESRFVLFPLYWAWRHGERWSTHVVWPFFNYVSEGGWDGWRLWPFYGRYYSSSADGLLEYDRSFVFWPFYIRHRDNLTVDPTDLFFSLPFYGVRTNSRAETRTYFWPFFGAHFDKKYDLKTYFGYLIPYRFTNGQTDVWPIFGVKWASEGTEIAGVVRRSFRQFVIWPIERYDWGAEGLGETTRFWLLPLLWHFYYIDRDTLRTETEWTGWPLFRYRREGENVSFDAISPLWFRREDYDRLYSRWFNVFRYRWKPDLSGWEILYGALVYRRDEVRAERVVSVLGGLLEVGSIEGGLALRILYLPWR